LRVLPVTSTEDYILLPFVGEITALSSSLFLELYRRWHYVNISLLGYKLFFRFLKLVRYKSVKLFLGKNYLQNNEGL
jgi:hypothetical protein